jgi:hypothetical protein
VKNASVEAFFYYPARYLSLLLAQFFQKKISEHSQDYRPTAKCNVACAFR